VSQQARLEVLCWECYEDLVHCHGTAIVHLDVIECTEHVDCRVGGELHHFVWTCDTPDCASCAER